MIPIEVGEYAVAEYSVGTYVVRAHTDVRFRGEGWLETVTTYSVEPVGHGRAVEVFILRRDRATGVLRRMPVDEFSSLPMALRVAAEAAGIERQRVVVDRHAYDQSPRHALITRSHDWADYHETYDLTPEELEEIADVAHEYARERYAALTEVTA